MKRLALEAAAAAEGRKIFDMTRERLETETRVDAILATVKAELLRATEKHGPMGSPHEAFGVIYEEFNVEFVAEMVANNREKQKIEMTQVAAMAVRFLLDLTDAGK